MLSSSLLFLLSTVVSSTAAAAVDALQHADDINLVARDTVNGSCISAPDEACVSLVGLCVASVASGQVSDLLILIRWQMSAVLDAACCAGSCHTPVSIASLDYDTVRGELSLSK